MSPTPHALSLFGIGVAFYVAGLVGFVVYLPFRDRRIANMRLRAGGEVTPDSARHMGLFVVGRLADRHGIRVRLRGSSIEEARSGTTAEVYLPATVLASADAGPSAPREPAAVAPAVVPLPEPPAAGSPEPALTRLARPGRTAWLALL